MEQNDDEIREYVRFKSARLMSAAIYEKLKAVVLAREREEHGKSMVVSRALMGLLALSVFAVLVALGTQQYAGLWIAGGFLVWVAFVIALMRRHLDSQTKEDLGS